MTTQRQSPPTAPDLPVTPSPVDWATLQLIGFLGVVSAAEDGRAAIRDAVDYVSAALGADVAALVWGDEVAASVGFPADPALEPALVDVALRSSASLVVPRLGICPALSVPVTRDVPAALVLARSSPNGFGADELHLARAMAQVLGLCLRMFRLADGERAQRREAETQAELAQRLFDSLQNRQRLLERLASIQRSIVQGAPRREVLDAICHGAQELVGDDVGGMQLLVADDPSMVELICATGDNPAARRGERAPVDQGLSGRAMRTDQLVVSDDSQRVSDAIPLLEASGALAAMAAPVHEHGRVVGSLVVASFTPGRRYSAIERDLLIAFADHASLALSDTRRT